MVSELLPGDEGVLLAGIVLGRAGELGWEVKTAMQRAGLTHIVAASGYNVSVVAGWLMAGGVKMLGRRWGIIMAGAGVMAYMGVAGWSPAVVRAGIMALLGLAAAYTGRGADKWWVLGLTVLGMAVINPKYLTDVGWQLSVAATVGVLFVSNSNIEYRNEPATRAKQDQNTRNKILNTLYEELKITLAAQVMTLPLILYYFGNLSIIAPLSNLAVLWVVPIVMQVGLAAFVVSAASPAAGQFVAYLAWPWLKYIVSMVSWMGGWEWAAVSIGKLSWVGVAGCYLIITSVMLARRKRI